jgi:flagellar basal body-associated protein FliL
MRFFVMGMLKKNLSIILVILLTLLLVAMVIWLFNKRIEGLEKGKSNSAVVNKEQPSLRALTTFKL